MPIKKLVMVYAAMIVGSKAGLLSPRASRIEVAMRRRKGNTSMSIEPITPGEREPPKLKTIWDIRVLLTDHIAPIPLGKNVNNTS